VEKQSAQQTPHFSTCAPACLWSLWHYLQLVQLLQEQASDMAHMLPRKKQKVDHDVPAALRLGKYESGSQDSLPCFHDAAVQEGTPEPSGRLISGENAQSVGNCDFQTLK